MDQMTKAPRPGVRSSFGDALRTLYESAKAVGGFAFDTLLPSQCPVCTALVSGPMGLCGRCFHGVTWCDQGFCDRCATPLPEETRFSIIPLGGQFHDTGHRTCPLCRARPSPVRRTRAAMVYDQGCREMLLKFKHADRQDYAPLFARWLAHAGQDLWADAPILCPVPLHWTRLLKRRYNQSALLARAIAKRQGLTWAPQGLIRQRKTASQGAFDHADSQPIPQARRENVLGAFGVPSPEQIAGRTIVLVDDVMTTGATAEECAKTLLDSGARTVDVLVIARALLEQ